LLRTGDSASDFTLAVRLKSLLDGARVGIPDNRAGPSVHFT
jgi:hypothetical protein